MKARTVKYIFRQGLTGLWRNRTMSIASIRKCGGDLIILGLVIILVLNISNLADLAQMQFDEVQVYLKDDLFIAEIDNIGKEIKMIEGVRMSSIN